MADTGIKYGTSSLGVTLSYGIGTYAEKPSAFTLLNRINDLGETAAEQENIDASALEDQESHNIPGRTSVSDSKEVAVNETDKTVAEWEKVISDYKAMESGQCMWFQTITPGLSKASFIIAAPPSILPDSAKGQNGLNVMNIPLTVEAMKGRDTKITPSANTAGE